MTDKLYYKFITEKLFITFIYNEKYVWSECFVQLYVFKGTDLTGFTF